MDCSLWLNRKKINSAVQISDNLDVASLRGYFLGGSLIEWLDEHNGKEYADKLRFLSADTPDINEKIAEIFGGKADFGREINGCAECDNTPTDKEKSDCVSAASFTPPNSFVYIDFSAVGSASAAEISSFLSYVGGSFTLGSFSEHEWEWLWNFLRGSVGGSFITSSFLSGSFVGGSFAFGNFMPSSLTFGSFSAWEWFSAIMSGSFNGSFSKCNIWGIDEYDWIMFRTLMRCPLDCFGYGIHIV